MQVRLFRETDSERIRQLYKEGMLYGANSPGKVALERQLYLMPSLVLYSIFFVGLIVSYHYLALGSLMSVVSLSLFLAWRQNFWQELKRFDDSAMNGDLANIGRQYGAAPNAFWVAELKDDNGAGTIIGCIGLDSSTNPDPTTAEIRRVVVSPSHQNQGVGSSLLKTAIAHAKAQNMDKIMLSTTMFQPAARKMYERFGFVEEKKGEAGVQFLFLSFKVDFYIYGLKL